MLRSGPLEKKLTSDRDRRQMTCLWLHAEGRASQRKDHLEVKVLKDNSPSSDGMHEMTPFEDEKGTHEVGMKI
jgi:hypothetical protein